MNPRIKGAVRRSQLITTYGVGAVVAARDESFMVAGLDRWSVGRPNVHEPRLERLLDVQGFVLPPAGDEGQSVPVVRFPRYYYCPNCNRLAEHRFFTGLVENKCPECNVDLVPSRFVVACDHGHIDDFPYFQWVHAGTGASSSGNHHLYIEAGGVSASLDQIIIRCSCGRSRTMKDAFRPKSLARFGHCSGNRPWIGDKVPCNLIPRVLQRGASNVYFPIVRSSISIPPWSEGAFRAVNASWHILRHVPDVALVETIRAIGLAQGTPYTPEILADVVLRRKTGAQDPSDSAPWTQTEFRRQEYEALLVGREEISSDQDFVCVPANVTDPQLARWFSAVKLVKRLREVRALQSFTRLLPLSPADPPERRAPLSATEMPWLPAIEVRGEGVFLRLNEETLAAWESRPAVCARADRINARYLTGFTRLDAEPDRRITPRLLLIHALAHALIDQWSLDSGYPAAALRERLYVADDMAGLLIYTATGDSAGSLGGVIAQADNDRLWDALNEAVSRHSWCSSDPLCIESEGTGVDSLNLAACHACLLLPEVSCEEANTLLDRAMLVGTPADPDIGFFRQLLD